MRESKPREPREAKGRESKARARSGGTAKPARRVHEVFGIVTLAAALLIGPSLASHQFGEGQLMGPFGRAVGAALNWCLGLGGYLLVLVLLITALRIFAGGLGLVDTLPRSPWRERLGLLLLTLSGSALLHLATRPTRIRGASAGGILGEINGELLCALASSAGAWVIALSALALALVLATNLSWARAGLAVLRLAHRALCALPGLAARSHRHLASSVAHLAQLLRRRELCADAGGVAALSPPVVRLDLAEPTRAPEPPPPPPEEEPEPLPTDLEIGRVVAPPELPEILIEMEDTPPEIVEAPPPLPPEEPAESEQAAATAVQSAAAVPAVAEPCAPPAIDRTAPASGLTIVQPQFRESGALPEAEAVVDEKHVEPGDGPGFVLHGDVYRPPPLSLLEYEESA